MISIHAPHTGRDSPAGPQCQRYCAISIHAPHTGRDLLQSGRNRAEKDFNPRAPYGARRLLGLAVPLGICISIHAPHTGRDAAHRIFCIGNRAISIHAPHTGRDCFSAGGRFQSSISIHAPHTGRDLGRYGVLRYVPIFQSTRPIRGATWSAWRSWKPPTDFNPRAPYGARHSDYIVHWDLDAISIHAPHTGRDSREQVTPF